MHVSLDEVGKAGDANEREQGPGGAELDRLGVILGKHVRRVPKAELPPSHSILKAPGWSRSVYCCSWESTRPYPLAWFGIYGHVTSCMRLRLRGKRSLTRTRHASLGLRPWGFPSRHATGDHHGPLLTVARPRERPPKTGWMELFQPVMILHPLDVLDRRGLQCH